MAKTTNFKDQVYAEVGDGKRARRVVSVPFIVADARTNMTDPNHLLADCITNTTIQKAIFIAPCKGKIIKVSANAVIYPVNGGAASTITVDVKKAVIGGADVSALNSLIGIEGGTADTATHGTLSVTSGALDFIEGQLIYAEIIADATAITARSNGAVVTVEWYPTER